MSSFRRTVKGLADSGAWVMDGNYLDEVGRTIVWPRADTLVWLDLPRRLAIARTLRRAVVRVVTRTTLWGTNRQVVSTLSPASIARLIRRWPAYSVRIESALGDGAYPGLTVVRFRRDSDVRRWLRAVEQHIDRD